MTHAEKALTRLHEAEAESRGDYLMQVIDPRAKVIVTMVYIAAVLSFSLTSLSAILLFAIYPIVGARMSGIPYVRLMRRSLIALPFVVFIGIFNPVADREPMLVAGSFVISRGWVEFASIVVRGILTVQGALLLIGSTGFHRVCRGLRALGVPSVFTTQLLLVHRYIYVLIDEAISMDRARRSRSYGRSGYGLRMWGTFIGQLLIRTINRADSISRAMLARGFDGKIRTLGRMRWTPADTLFTLLWTSLFIAGRLCDVGRLFHFTLT